MLNSDMASGVAAVFAQPISLGLFLISHFLTVGLLVIYISVSGNQRQSSILAAVEEMFAYQHQRQLQARRKVQHSLYDLDFDESALRSSMPRWPLWILLGAVLVGAAYFGITATQNQRARSGSQHALRSKSAVDNQHKSVVRAQAQATPKVMAAGVATPAANSHAAASAQVPVPTRVSAVAPSVVPGSQTPRGNLPEATTAKPATNNTAPAAMTGDAAASRLATPRVTQASLANERNDRGESNTKYRRDRSENARSKVRSKAREERDLSRSRRARGDVEGPNRNSRDRRAQKRNEMRNAKERNKSRKRAEQNRENRDSKTKSNEAPRKAEPQKEVEAPPVNRPRRKRLKINMDGDPLG